MKVKVVKKQENSKMCFICGVENPIGTKSPFYELENGEVMCYFEGPDEYQSYPQRMHGGISATVLDEAIGRAILVHHPDLWGVTIDLSLRYRKPVPLNTKLRCVARIIKDTKRIFEGEGEILLPDGSVAVEATGRYFKMPIEKIAENAEMGEEMLLIPDDVTEVER